MYQIIVNPVTNRKVQINTRLGRKVLKNYYSHYQLTKNNHQQGGAGLPALLAIVAVGKLGYYYFYSPQLRDYQDISDLNELSYLERHHPDLAKKIKQEIKNAEEVMKEIQQQEEKTDIMLLEEISPEEESAFLAELSDQSDQEILDEFDRLVMEEKRINKGGGTGIVTAGVAITVRLGLVGLTTYVGHYVWDNYLSGTRETGPVPEIGHQPIVLSNQAISDGWEIITTPEAHPEGQVDKLNTNQAEIQINNAISNLVAREKQITRRLATLGNRNIQETRLSNTLNKSRKQITRQLSMLRREVRKLRLLKLKLQMKKDGQNVEVIAQKN